VRQEELKDTFQKEEFELEERVVEIRRTTKVVAGGKNLHFRVLAVVGDKNGKVGIGIGSAREVPESIRKAIAEAKKNMVQVSIVNDSSRGDGKVLFGENHAETGGSRNGYRSFERRSSGR